jgi:hypothetical protein
LTQEVDHSLGKESEDQEGRNMRRLSAWLGFSLGAAGLLTAIAGAAQTERLNFLSTQLRPIEEAQRMRTMILKGFPREVNYITEQPQQFPMRIKAERDGGTHTISCNRRAARRTPVARAARRISPTR